MNTRRKEQSFPFSMLVSGVLLLSMLLSACSSSAGVDSSTTSSSTSSTTAPAQAPTRKPGPLADQPLGAKISQMGSPLPANTKLTLNFNLAFNGDAMDKFIADLYTPGSANYRQYLTPTQIVQRFGMPDAQIKLIQDWLTQQGYTIVSIDGLHTSIKVTGTVKTVETSLGTQIRSFKLIDQTFYMQTQEPKLPSAIAPYVQTITGLNNLALPKAFCHLVRT